ncbi:MAG: DUF1294 domain-containing protein [Peptoniphilaceae bacterium]|uniref:DUF1294 domain-containing protein n=1 Tax=Parvimonas sp. TaxID=1944660 RepID=UPI0025E772FC|nr:DUF1294 domain-containing protein [Parvimonas sp.]MCI5997131.1 DUF1294 domain-containing protein [Parvimonas sp.]MDD7764887.1 DUF1294 domain-containing protein [Peptoniphilaceae bacterium]MDY3050105.1 DUF1294 domain-containing protein [Parvimonas sp.]
MKYIYIILAIVNIYTFILFGVDKNKARRNEERISERKLLLSSFLFGAFGAILAMNIFRHKTMKIKFAIGIPMFLVLQLLALYKIQSLFKLL